MYEIIKFQVRCGKSPESKVNGARACRHFHKLGFKSHGGILLSRRKEEQELCEKAATRRKVIMLSRGLKMRKASKSSEEEFNPMENERG